MLRMEDAMILLVDNYDSFTYNLVQRLGELDPSLELEVHRNDRITLDEIEARRPSHLIISPGPCTPDRAGISVPCVGRFAGRIPLLGVCLGHQSIGQAFGAKIVRAAAPCTAKPTKSITTTGTCTKVWKTPSSPPATTAW